MLRPSDEERLSAYFDEELSSEERVEAEHFLEENAAARDWLDQIGDLHAELQVLPQLRLPDDFAEGVLRRAEREMLLQGDVHERHAREPIAAPGRNGEASRNGTEVLLALGQMAGDLAGDVMAGDFSRPAAESPTVARAARRAGSDAAATGWHAPSWLAAAASLLLFAGVVALGTSERNWAGTASRGDSTPQRERTARNEQPALSDELAQRAKNRRGPAGSATRSDQAAGRYLFRGKTMPVDGLEDSDRDGTIPSAGAPDKADDTTYRFAERSNAAPVGAAQAPLGQALEGGGSGGFAGAGGPAGAPFGKSPPPAEPASGEAETFAFFSALSAKGTAANGRGNNGPTNVVVVDMDGTPAEAFARIEQALLLTPEVLDASGPRADERKQAAGQAVNQGRLHPAPDRTAILEKAADAQQLAEKSQPLSDPVAARVYFVNLPPEQLARTLRDVAGVATSKADIAVTNLGAFATPPQGGEAMFELGKAAGMDSKTRATLGGTAEPAPTDIGSGNAVTKRVTGAALPGPQSVRQGKPAAEDIERGQMPREDGPNKKSADKKGADKKSADQTNRLRSAAMPAEREQKREKDGAPPRDAAPTGASASAKFAAPAGGMAKAPDGNAAPVAEQSRAKLSAGKEALRTANGSNGQPQAQTPRMPAAERTTSLSFAPTIIVFRVNQPSRPVAPAAAPASPSK